MGRDLERRCGSRKERPATVARQSRGKLWGVKWLGGGEEVRTNEIGFAMLGSPSLGTPSLAMFAALSRDGVSKGVG